MSESTIELKKKYFKFREEMIDEMESIGLDHCFPYMLEQYFEDFEDALCMDEWEIPEWYDKVSDLNDSGIKFTGMRK